MPKAILLVGFDHILVFSCTFLLLYLAALLTASFIPARWKVTPSPACIPLVAALSAILMFTQWELFLRSVLRWLVMPVFSSGPGATHIQHTVILAIWLGGAALCLLRTGKNMLALFYAARYCSEAEPDPAFEDALRRSGLRRRVRVLYSPAFGSVSSWALWNAHIFVPPDFYDSCDAAERQALYLHELTHIQSKDSLKCLAADCLVAFFWFNPVFFHALGRFKNHVEIACDKAVLRLGVTTTAYVDLVAKFIAAKREDAPALNFSSTYKDTARRFRYIFGNPSCMPATEDRLLAKRCLVIFAFVAILAIALSTEDLNVYPRTGETVTMESEDGVVVREHYLYSRQGVIGNFTRSKVISRGYSVVVE